MNALAEALGMSLPGSASIPAPYRERGACAYQTGKRIVDLVRQDVKPSDILTKKAFENAIAACTAIGGSTNAPIHLNAIAKHVGVKLECDDWERVGYELPLLLNIQPAGQYLCEEYHRAGGLPGTSPCCYDFHWLMGSGHCRATQEQRPSPSGRIDCIRKDHG